MKCKRAEYFVEEAKEGFQAFFETYLFPHFLKKKSIESDRLKCDNMVKISKSSLEYNDIPRLKEKWEKEKIVFRDAGSKMPLFKLLCGFDYDEPSCPYFALLSFYDEVSEEVVFLMRVPIAFKSRKTGITVLGALGGMCIGALKAKSSNSEVTKGVFWGGIAGAITSYVMNILIE